MVYNLSLYDLSENIDQVMFIHYKFALWREELILPVDEIYSVYLVDWFFKVPKDKRPYKINSTYVAKMSNLKVNHRIVILILNQFWYKFRYFCYNLF